jgi:hypothetical protein
MGLMSHFNYVRCSEHYLSLKRHYIEPNYVWKYLKWSPGYGVSAQALTPYPGD